MGKGRALILVLGILLCLPAKAQDVGSVFGDRITPLPPAPTTFRMLVDEAPRPVWFVAPVFFDVDGATVGELGAGVILPTRGQRPLRLDIAFASIDPEGAGSVERLSVAARYRLFGNERLILNALARHADGDEVARRTEAGLHAEWRLYPRLALSALARAAQKASTASEEEDLIVKPGITLALTESLAVGADYTFENDVDGSDSYSAAVSWQVLPPFNLTVFAGKDDLIGVAGFVAF